MKIITDKEVSRTPVVQVCGQGDTDRVAGTLTNAAGTTVIGHEFDGQIHAVVDCIDTDNWLAQAVGDDEIDDQRTVAQVVVGQAEFADVLVLTEPEYTTLAVLKRLAPRSRSTVGTKHLEMALRHLDAQARRGADIDPHDPLLAGQPPLTADGSERLLTESSRRMMPRLAETLRRERCIRRPDTRCHARGHVT